MDALLLYKLPLIPYICIHRAEGSDISSKSLHRSLEGVSFVKFQVSDTSRKESSSAYLVKCTIDIVVGDDIVSVGASFDTPALIELPALCIDSTMSAGTWYGVRLTSNTRISIIETNSSSALSFNHDESCTNWTHSFPENSLQPFPSVSIPKAEQLYRALPDEVVAALSGVARSVLDPSALSNEEVMRTGSVLLCGASGSGGKTLMQCIARRFDAHILTVSAATFYAGVTTDATKEWAQKQVRQLVLGGLSLGRCVLFLSDLHLLAPAAPARSTDARLTEAEEGVSEALSAAIRELETLQRSTGPAGSRSSHQRIQLLLAGYAHDEQQVHASVRESFQDKVHISLPSARERRTLMRTVWEERHPHVEYPAQRLNTVADSSTGLAVLPLLHACRAAVEASEVTKTASSTTGVLFAQVAGLAAVKRVLQETVLWPRRYASLYRAFSAPGSAQGEGGSGGETTVGLCAGILLFGPPGTGKTLLPRTLAEDLGCSLVNLRISDIVRGEIGTSEKRVVQLFLEAKRCAPSVLFIDEFQALFTSRAGDGDNNENTDSGLTVTLSGCFDDLNVWNRNAGAESLVTVIASTNEPWAIDPGFLRPGRLDKCVFVGPLDESGRLEFLTKRLSVSAEISNVAPAPTNATASDNNHAQVQQQQQQQQQQQHALVLAQVAAATQGFTGADLTLLLARAEDARAARCAGMSLSAIDPSLESEENCPSQASGKDPSLLSEKDFDFALHSTRASTCAEDILDYTEWLEQYPYLR